MLPASGIFIVIKMTWMTVVVVLMVELTIVVVYIIKQDNTPCKWHFHCY